MSDILWDEDPIQAVLGLPEVDRTETKRKLMEIFAVYRRYKRQIANDEPPDLIRVYRPAKDGCDKYMDPDLIRSPSPRRTLLSSEDEVTRRRRRFVEQVEKYVERLPDVQYVLVKQRYMGLNEPPPQDVKVLEYLKERRLVFSEREYYREKYEALFTLAESLCVLVFEIPV